MVHRLDRRCLLAFAVAGAGAPRRLLAADPFAIWLDDLGREARGQGVRAATVEHALRDLRPLPRVLELDRSQPETRLTFAQYRAGLLSDERIARGRSALAQNRELLRRTQARYGVPARILVALWGIESNFGRHQGGYPVIASLATLAYGARRTALFRKELISALRVLDTSSMRADELRGSWAGAMGQPQFMPSTYEAFAVDADGDGRRDIWTSLPDVLASMANYLKAAGWQPGWRWGREVQVPADLPGLTWGLEHKATLGRWRSRGVRPIEGGRLPAGATPASLVQPDRPTGPAWLVYPNFRTLLVWNRSVYFALGVGLLSDMLEDS